MLRSDTLLPTCRDLPDAPARRILDGLLNLLYPDACLICSAPVARVAERSLCRICWHKILEQRIAAPFCPICGLPFRQFDDGAAHLCGKCILCLPPYSGARAFGYYGAGLGKVIQALKFDGRKNLAGLLVPLMASAFLATWRPGEIELIVPVPLHARRMRERGYNQSVLLGCKLARQVGVPFCAKALVRVRPTAPQVGLSDSARVHNVRGAFRCRKPGSIRGRHVLLVDDVMTTGSTAASACGTLLEAGAARVSVLTAARAAVGWE